MRADFHNLTVLHNDNAIGIDDGRQSVRYNESRTAFKKRVERLLNMALAFRVKRTCRFVKQNDGCIF